MTEGYTITRDGALSKADARALTDKVKRSATELWADLLALYNGNAHTALGYSSWAVYCQVELELSQRPAYYMLNAARVMDQLPNGPSRDASEPWVTALPRNERVARELTPALKTGDVAQTWADVVERHGPEPTARQVREVVREHHPPAAPPVQPKRIEQSWAARMTLLAGELRHIAHGEASGKDDHIQTALGLMEDVHNDLRRLSEARG